MSSPPEEECLADGDGEQACGGPGWGERSDGCVDRDDEDDADRNC